MKPLFEFDAEKNKRNKEKHGLDLIEAQTLWDDAHFTIPARDVGGENRSAILGRVKGRLHVAVFTSRSSAVRIISYHIADKRLNRIYERLIHEKKES